MCITSRPALLSNTRIYVGAATHNDKPVHVLAYQNAATSDDGEACAMVLPVPAAEELGEANLIDTTKFKNFLKDISNTSKIQTLSFEDGLSRGVHTKGIPRAKVFDVGSYTVVLAKDTDAILPALEKVPDEKRPEITPDLLDGLRKLYPGHQWLVCCWKGSVKPEPVLCWYVPTDPSRFFIPTLDAHDGGAPKVGEPVAADHVISIGNADEGSKLLEKVRYGAEIPENVRHLLPARAWGTKLPKRVPNADCYVLTDFTAGTGLRSIFPFVSRGIGNKIFDGIRMEGWH